MLQRKGYADNLIVGLTRAELEAGRGSPLLLTNSQGWQTQGSPNSACAHSTYGSVDLGWKESTLGSIVMCLTAPLPLELGFCEPGRVAWHLDAGPRALEPGAAVLIHAKEGTQVALSIYSLFMKEEKQGPSCHGNQEHHGPLSLQWEEGQVSSCQETSTVYISRWRLGWAFSTCPRLGSQAVCRLGRVGAAALLVLVKSGSMLGP